MAGTAPPEHPARMTGIADSTAPPRTRGQIIRRGSGRHPLIAAGMRGVDAIAAELATSS
ncbi:hypothetical protein [Nocardia carnea]|uniref:hypothetical protein n=1 Tax=Nocardia carnea TaxID=37328 RepID=UPI002454CA54|nr:hypothetical protein [Nocardia carnea]